MIKKLLFFMVPFLSACGPKIIIDKDPYFDKFISRFKSDAQINQTEIGSFNNILIINFSSLAPELNGECFIKKEKIGLDIDIFYSIQKDLELFTFEIYRQITFNETMKILPLSLQYQLFLHEIGHCAYHLSDNNDVHSIMYKNLNNLEDLFPAAIIQFFDDARKNNSNWSNQEPIQN